jgi:hypothetical protein
MSSEQRDTWLIQEIGDANYVAIVDEQGCPVASRVYRDDAAQVIADRERVEVLEAALHSAIRSHENLVELDIVPPQYKPEARRLAEQWRAALARPAATGDGAQEARARAEGE